MHYVAGNLTTAVGEAFGAFPTATICPNYRLHSSIRRARCRARPLQSTKRDANRRIPSLATGDYLRGRTQEWARAIYEDQPVARRHIHGIYYVAAHSIEPALAVWNTELHVRVTSRLRRAHARFCSD
ncbi:hypothetical protein [Skermania sp. ID1734]|uniref:hypothetical protein n=1 Tax=Skermania sp. ID1734 TaxID=2597516 RepID=UPI00351BA2E5